MEIRNIKILFIVCLSCIFFGCGGPKGVEVTSVTWSCNPNPIDCDTKGGKKATISVDVTFELHRLNMQEHNPNVGVSVHLMDDEWIPDYLGQANQIHSLVTPRQGASTRVTKSFTIDVFCDNDCYVSGIAGSSGETSAECYLEVVAVDFDDKVLYKTENKDIDCTEMDEDDE